LDLSNVRLVMAGGGACPTVVYEAFWEKDATCVKWGPCET